LENIITNLYTLYDKSGTFYGAFDGDQLVGIFALDSEFIGKKKDTLLLDFLHVDRKYRKKNIGKSLLDIAAKKAKDFGPKKLYISATPSKNTIDFYFHIGCKLTAELNNDLYELEPEDIHLQLDLMN
jgi:predicted N-acetyltransferase YhbS